MKTIGTIALALAATLALSACDPYTDEKTGPGQILSVFASSTHVSTTDGTRGTGGAWTIPGFGSEGGFWPVIWVRFDKLLDGNSIQSPGSANLTDPTSTQSCVPAAAMGLTVTGPTTAACPAGSIGYTTPRWFACYVPNTAIETEGAGVVFYQGCDDIASTNVGWNDLAVLEDGASYRIVANVKDKQGRTYPIDVSFTTLPAATELTIGTATATSVPLTWTAAAGATSYDVERAPDVSGAAGTYAALAGASGLTGLAFTDTTVATATTYWYRIRSHAANGEENVSAEASVTTP